jgi:hypothetical protein
MTKLANITFTVLTACVIFALFVQDRRWVYFKRKLQIEVLFIKAYICFGPGRDEVTGEWRKLYNEELNDLYSSPNIVRVIKSRRMRWAGHVVRMGERRGVYRVLVRKPEEKRPLERPRCRWQDNIKMSLQELGCGGVVWIELSQDRDRWRAASPVHYSISCKHSLVLLRMGEIIARNMLS